MTQQRRRQPPEPGRDPRQSRRRNDYSPSVRPRTAREEGAVPLRPDVLRNISDTKIAYVEIERTLPSYIASEAEDITGSSLVVNKPTGTQEDDVLIAAFAYSIEGTVTPPSGFTQFDLTIGASTPSIRVYHKTATASEPANYTWQFSVSTNIAVVLATFRDVDTTDPINESQGQQTPSATSHATPDITTTVPGTLLLAFHNYQRQGNWTAPSGMTEREDTALTGADLALSTAEFTSEGATGAKTATTNGIADIGAALLVALKPNNKRKLFSPSTNKRLRLVRAEVFQPTTDGEHFAELYFGNHKDALAANAASNGGVIDILKIPDLGSDQTRTWSRAQGPVGDKNAQLTLHFLKAIETQHLAIIEYTEES